MSVNNIDQVLAQMRVIKAQAMGNPELTDPGAESVSFSSMLKQTIDSVNRTQLQASEMKQAFELGDKEVNLAEVMVAVQKSDISFEAMVQVRNKLIDAYKEVMNMPI
ncbi:MAG: flagellar hook-basal body complex protein FliE [Gammaproteobacteria bacterium]|nr:flagellar hook-basal body complex protein FliE [Gammaproteobacteria bacterium]HXK55786.1 flagellar hook-basal body complex protein FliE [Gammaproteobacteria bacterium]